MRSITGRARAFYVFFSLSFGNVFENGILSFFSGRRYRRHFYDRRNRINGGRPVILFPFENRIYRSGVTGAF